MKENKEYKLPELLAPAADMDALKGAIAGGADAVYFGTDLFNARMRARNFTLDDAKEAIRLCHAHGVRAFVTLNIEIYERELPKALEYALALYEAGVDALIVADYGLMTLLRAHLPNLEIHASTQACVHNLDGVRALEKIGCSRVVVARELDRQSISKICHEASAQIEIFVHGAHCMSMSGQCLMSYAMGGRSGNRGECAQPCRLPYRLESQEYTSSGYPLSLKDMSLATKIPEIIDTGASSLKIEGRMKGADYVFGVSSIWRALLDKRARASEREMRSLGALFCRQGFTSGYFDNFISDSMLGVRSEENKDTTRTATTQIKPLERPQIDIFARFIEGEEAMLTVSYLDRSVTVYGDIVEGALNAPMSEDDLKRSLSKLGATPFTARSITVEKSEHIMVRVSSLNALRRRAIDVLLGAREPKIVDYVAKKRTKSAKRCKSAFFSSPSQITDTAREYFDIIYTPLFNFSGSSGENGVCLPPVILDSEWDEVTEMLTRAHALGAQYALVTNIGQLQRVSALGFVTVCDFRFNVFNTLTLEYLDSLGVYDVILSPELSIPQARDMAGYSIIAYGKFPVMTNFKCLFKDKTNCKKCSGYLVDRTGAKMLCQREYGHRTVIYNSVPIYMADKAQSIDGFSWHFIFSDEAPNEVDEIIGAYKAGAPTDKKIRRIAK